MVLSGNHINNQSRYPIVTNASASRATLLVQNVFPESSRVIHLLQDPSTGKLEKVKLAAVVTFGKLLKLIRTNCSGFYGYIYCCAFYV